MKQSQLRIKKRTSVSKINKQKQFNMTVSTALFPSSQKQLKQLPPIKRNLRKPLEKLSPISTTLSSTTILPRTAQYKQRKQTQTTLNEDSINMQQSQFFATISKGWIKPSDYLKNIQQLNLQNNQSQKVQVQNYEIKLNDKMQNNMKKIDSLFKLTQKWVDILKKALFYITSKKTNSQKLNQQIKFWRLLSKKFDQLQYEFNNQKTIKLNILMKNSLKTTTQHRKIYEQYEDLKQQVINKCIQIKKLYLSLEEIVTGAVIKFQQSSDIKQSINLLKKILFTFNNLSQLNGLLDNRLEIIYKKINIALVGKLLAAPLYPRQLANISGLKLRYQLIDNAMSFYSNFLSILEQNQQKYQSIIQQAQYTRNIISNLMQILCYFQYLYKKKQVLQFSKLFGYEIDFNIFDPENSNQWQQYMSLVQQSMENKKYQS